ncbi:MAG: hypothetical protein A2Y25_09105 [Candidatus Melainabacteria bacterium GWF2_37_15]|nr:MAG: hypothetical protein A2Y25_09105 [Candidatus Melainabacteria bacterium GWF2_37_15]
MKLENQTASDLLGKNKEKSQAAAKYIINTPDIKAWQCLLENSDYVFSFIKEKAGRAIANEINKENADKVFELLKFHAPDWDDYIAEGLSRLNDEDISHRMMELLNTGSLDEKTYAARYFCFLQYPSAAESLFEASKSYCQQLKSNASEALGSLKHEESYKYYLEQLKSSDEWDKIEAAQFLASYGNKDATIPILVAMEHSGMAELIAGEIATLVDIHELFEENDEKTRILALEALDNIISGIPEVWSLRSVLDFKIYECMDKLVNLSKNDNNADLAGRYAQILLKAKQKFNMFINNSQYTYDEENDIMAELDEIYHLLMYENEKFWDMQLQRLLKELEVNDAKRKLAAIAVFKETEARECIPCLIKLTLEQNEDEAVISEAIITLAKMGHTSEIDKDLLLSRIKDPNLFAVVENCLAGNTSQQSDF